MTRSTPRRRPNCSRRLHPGVSPGNTERIPFQPPRVSCHPRQPEPDWVSPEPMLRCKRRSQLPRYRSPVRPHVLHPLPLGEREGDLNAIADRTYPSTRDVLGITKRASGQHQGRSLMYRQPVSLHELHPAHDGTVGRVDRYDFNSFPVTSGQKGNCSRLSG